MENQQHITSNGDDNNDQTDTMSAQDKEVLAQWSASEYIAHHKSTSWYVGLGVVVALFSLVVYALTRDVVSTVVIVVVGILFGVFAGRPPEVRTYQITPAGLAISEKLYDFHMFKSFSVHDEGVVRSIFFTPVKRFMPGISVYYPLDQEEEIVNILADYLPNEETNPSAIDNFMRKVRF